MHSFSLYAVAVPRRNSRFTEKRRMTLKKSELVAALAYHVESSKAEAERFLEAFGKTIHAEITKVVKIVVPEVGTFQLSRKEARKGRNPQTGEEIQIAARNNVTFKAAKSLQDKVNP